ncbi:MAG: B12-binding domain-containing radical SAM protein, partial [Phyllobacteriaceae bacterium]|nr:B12-binding domain-containing radical SAM protein [Phyllobacteriaceae bacterium]
MRLTFVYPAVGRKQGVNYMRSWQMEPLPIAALAGLTPGDVETRFYDDRLEAIDFDAPADLVAIPVETYTAKRAYQIASEFRRRKVPVVMGGFHATLATDEVSNYAEAVVVGEAETVWGRVIDDARHGTLQKLYPSSVQPDLRPDLRDVRYNREIFAGRNYLPVGLVETSRGCRFPCDFCAIQTFFSRTARHRPVDAIVRELAALKVDKKIFFFVDDNFAADIAFAAELAEALTPLAIRWVTQLSINAAHDENLLAKLAASGCQGVLIGFESLDPDVLRSMRKGFNTMKGGFDVALANLRRHNIRVYGTFVFGYDADRLEAFEEAAEFALDHKFYLAAFNHLTPFPGTPLYRRLESENRLLYDAWWLDPRYRYNDLPFRPRALQAEEIRAGCIRAR